MKLGEKLAAARKALGLTQEALAEKLGVTFQAVSAWERDETVPDLKKLVTLGKVLHISMNSLLTEEDGGAPGQASLLDRAVAFAEEKHRMAKRKGTTIPYVSHVMEAMEIVCRLTEDEEVRAAAVLHDTLEDTDTTREELARLFGQRVADLVASESENKREGQPEAETWQTRKQETVRHLTGAGTDIRMIALGDKLANARAMYRDYQVLGEKLWDRFNMKDPILQGWYYGSLANVFGSDETLRGTPEYREYVRLCVALFSKEYGEEEPDGDAEPDTTSSETMLLDVSDDPERRQVEMMAAMLDLFMRKGGAGLGGVRVTFANEPCAEDVFWQKTEYGYDICLCAESGWNRCQVAYQLGYAMMHCMIDHLDREGRPGVVWAEELICETAALAVLDELWKNWDRTFFVDDDPEYAENVKEYLEENLRDEGTSALLRCGDLAALRAVNERNLFEDRLDESHDLFRALVPGDLMKLAEVRKYEDDDLLLDTHYWRAAAGGSAAVEYLCRLQERIPGCEIPMGVAQEIGLRDSRPTAEQRQAYAAQIRALRAHPCEYIRFSFLDDDRGPCEQIGLVYYRLARRKDGGLEARLRLDTAAGRKMYRLVTDDARAADILDGILVNDAVPALDDWQNITSEVFGAR